MYPLLATLLGLSLEPDATERVRELSRDSVREQTIDSVYRLVCALAQKEPVCVVLDDLHWADESTIELLEELLAITDEEAVALILLYRAEREHRSWRLGELARQRFPHRHHELQLEALASDASRRLAGAAAGAPLPEAVAELLAERAGGNPFLEEALRDLVERGAIRRANGRFELAVGIAELRIPTVVHEALQARLDRLGREARETLAVAAVIGRRFGAPLLERIVPRERMLPALSELQRLELVVEEPAAPPPSIASVTGSCRRSPTRACWKRGGGSCTAPSAARSRRSTGTLPTRPSSCSPAISARRTSPSEPCATCSRRETGLALSTPTRRRSTITARRLPSWIGRVTTRAPERRSSRSA